MADTVCCWSLLVFREQPWGMTNASVTDDQTAAKTCAAACAVQALKCDRHAGRAWALLSKLVVPSARRLHCITMTETVCWRAIIGLIRPTASLRDVWCHRQTFFAQLIDANPLCTLAGCRAKHEKYTATSALISFAYPFQKPLWLDIKVTQVIENIRFYTLDLSNVCLLLEHLYS